MSQPLSGIIPPLVTPLRDRDSLDIAGLERLIEHLISGGVSGLFILGTTGEGPSFSPAEREMVWRAALRVRETHPDFRLLAGTGTPSLQETVDLTKTAFDLGYDGVVVLPPYYFRTAGDEGLYRWFEGVIQKAVPADGYLLGYHFPNMAGIGFSLALRKRH